MTFNNFTTSLLSGSVISSNALNNGSMNVALSPLAALINLFIVMYGADSKSRENLDSVLWDGAIEYKVEKVEKKVDNTTILEEVVKRIVNIPKHDDLIAEAPKWVQDAIDQQHFSMNHAIYFQDGIKLKDEFQDQIRDLYKELRPKYNFVDFKKGDLKKITSDINEAFGQFSDGVITNIVSDDTLSNSDEAVLISSAFFTNPWKEPFDSLLTMKGSPFYLLGEEKEKWVPVNMMQLRGDSNKKFMYAEDLFGIRGSQSVQLPYQNNASLILLLPPSNSKKSIEMIMNVIRKEGQNFLSKLIEQHSETNLRFVQIPRMIIESSQNLISSLQTLGIKDIFENESNLNAMIQRPNGNEKLMITKVLQKVIIPLMDERIEAVDDENTSNRTVLVMPSASIKRATYNQPFFAFLVGKNQRLLFSTLILNPDNS